MADPTPTPSQHTYHGNPGALMSFLSTSVVFWLLLGALAYSDVISEEPHVVLNLFLCIISALTLGLANGELPSARLSSRAYRDSAYYTASITGFGASTVYALVSGNWGNGHRRIFWAMGGLYGGILLEATTGFYSSCARRLRESLYDSQTETQVSESRATEPQVVSEPQVSQCRAAEPAKQD